jgi:hypothetical protein
VNATNRALNRAAILVVGLVLLVLGAGVAVAAAVPQGLAAWQNAADSVAVPFDPAEPVTLAIVLAACVLAIVLLAVFVFRQGRGHARTLVRRGGSDGSVIVDAKVAATLIEAALEDIPAVASVSVSGYRVRRTPALKIAVTPRRGSSPTDLREAVDTAVERWDALLGSEVPVLVTIG